MVTSPPPAKYDINLHANIVLHNVDFLRFVCALIVLLSHTTNFLNIQSISASGAIAQHSIIVSAGELVFCGPGAVMMFFVISGLCIHAPNRAKLSLNIIDFYVRRFVRIGIPLFAAYVVKIFLVGGFSFEPLPVWSLWCEMFYYLIYPFLMLIIFRFGFAPVFAISLICAICLASTPDANDGHVWTYGSFLTWILFLPVWLLGMLTAENLQKAAVIPVHFRQNSILLMTALALIALGVLSTVLEFHLHRLIRYKWTMLAFGFPAAAFIFLLLSRRITTSPVMRFLERQGEWSYSLYLMHPIGIAIALDFLFALHIKEFGQLISLLILSLVLAAGFLTAILFFYLCERPSHLLAKRLAPRLGLISAANIRFTSMKFLGS